MSVYYKMRQILLQNTAAILLQVATVLLQMRQLLQNATFIRNCDSTAFFFL